MRFNWQNQRRAAPRMKAMHAGTPIITGQGRLGDNGKGTELGGGFRSAAERQIRTLMTSGNKTCYMSHGD